MSFVPAENAAASRWAVAVGQPVQAAGNLPAGTYRLCIVAQGGYTLNDPYTDQAVSCASTTTTRSPFGPITVWAQAQSGGYDLLVLGGAGTDTILGGDGLDSAVGLSVGTTVPAEGRLQPALALALAAALALRSRRRRSRV